MIKTNIMDDTKAIMDFVNNDAYNWDNGKYAALNTFSNENLTSLCKIVDLKDKNILSVASSGDYLINFILNDAKKVDTFDINIFTNYYQNLKIAAIKKLSYDEFIDFFVYHNFSKKTYAKFNEFLDLDTRFIFDVIFTYCGKKSIYYTNLFKKTNDAYISNFKNIEYIRKQIFDEAKEKMQDQKTTFGLYSYDRIPYNIYVKYDVIYLSDLVKHLNYTLNKDLLIKYHDYIINMLSKFLTNNGLIINYIPEYNNSTLSDVFNDFDLKEIDNNYNQNKKDGVLIYTKKR